MYGIVGQLRSTPGNRDELAGILVETTGSLPGCLSYVVAADAEDPDALWVTEVWEDEASHRASLTLPAVQAAIARGRPLIAGFGARHITTPVGGHGLVANPASHGG
jgi:quinol monooxygenase YgiN